MSGESGTVAQTEGAHAEGPAPIRVVLVDDHEMILKGLRDMLGNYPERVVVVGEGRDEATALAAVDAGAPDIVLTDVRLRGQSGLDLCRAVLQRRPLCRVVYLTVYDDEQYLFQALRLGASGFLLKGVSASELVAHLERVQTGELAIDPSLAGRVVLTAARLQSGEFWPGAHLGLSHRESDVLRLMVSGLSNKAIARKLVLGDETVKSHVASVYRKLDVSDRAQAVAVALREGLFH